MNVFEHTCTYTRFRETAELTYYIDATVVMRCALLDTAFIFRTFLQLMIHNSFSTYL